MWHRTGANTYSPLQAQRYLQQLYPSEVHNAGGDCINPKCDYEFNDQDIAEMSQMSGWFTCPNCQWTYNYLDNETNTKSTRTGLTPGEMGAIGESIVAGMGTIPLLGPITWQSTANNYPIDLIAGPYGVEVKTNHSESQPRFKMGGSTNGTGRSGDAASKMQYCEANGLKAALVGVRLNFYNDHADIFVRPDSFTDTWIGAGALTHVGTIDFSAQNPFKNPGDVPPPSELPDDDDIPF